MGKLKIKTIAVIFSLLVLISAPNAYALELSITGNGEGSENEVNVQVESETVIEQTNNADIDNDVVVESNTGDNVASDSISDEVAIETGDVATDVVIENQANSSEAESICCGSDTVVQISGNGESSSNTVNLEETLVTNIVIAQVADVNNNVVGTANTGDNSASNNLGNVKIASGDISVAMEIINDPINVSSVSESRGLGDVLAKISGNAKDSKNTINVAFLVESNVFLNSSSDIDNNFIWDLNTGGNEANDNYGDVEIFTGDIDFTTFVKNLTNLGGVDIDCCGVDDPNDPTDPVDPDDPSDPGDPGDPRDDIGGNGGGDDNNGSGDGQLLSAAAAIEAGGPGVAGLSDTSSAQAQNIFFWVGLILIGLGIKNLGEYLEKSRFSKIVLVKLL